MRGTKLFLIFGLVMMVTIVAARPTFASDATGNFFQNAFDSVTNTIQRLYLQWIPGDKPGTLVLKQAWVVTQPLQTVTAVGDVNATLLHDTHVEAQVHLNVKGPAQIQPQVGSTRANQDLQVQGDVSMQGTSLKTAADLKVAGDTIYFKLNEVPSVPNLDLSGITGQWYKTAGTAATPSAALSTEQRAQLQTAFAQLWQSAGAGVAHPDTKNNRAVFVVPVTLSRAALEEYLATVVTIHSQAKSEQSPQLTAALQATLRKNLDQINEIKMILWIDKSSFYPIHAESNITYSMNKAATASTAVQTGPLAVLAQVNQVKLSLQLDLSNFNQPISFVEPTDAQDSTTVFSSAVGKLLNAGNASAVGTSELPALTPYQRQQLQQLNSISSAQKQHFLDQLDQAGPLSTASGMAK